MCRTRDGKNAERMPFLGLHNSMIDLWVFPIHYSKHSRMILFHPHLCGIMSGTKHAFNLSVELLDPVAQIEQATKAGSQCMHICNVGVFMCRKPIFPKFIDSQIRNNSTFPFLSSFLALS